MRYTIIVISIFSAGVLAAHTQDDATKEHEALQGTWTAVSQRIEGDKPIFFDGKHFVMKGGSPHTAACMLRPSFRNWFQAHYQYVYAGFRLVSSS